MKVFIILLLAGLVLYVGITCQAKIIGQYKVLPSPSAYNAQEIKQRMLYHGTYVAWRDNNGTWFFHREGKVCVLHEPI